MCTFHYGGQSYETLDYSVMSSTPRRSYTEGTKSFNSRAEQEMRELEPEDYKHPFINVYSESGYVYHTGETKKALRLSLVGQDYIYSPSVKKMTFSSVMAVYDRTGCSYRQLWKLGRFVPEICPIFLNKKKLSDIMLTIFKKVQIRLGQLQEKGISFIAWEIETEKGTFYVPWHNGCLIEQTTETVFTEKTFAELKRTYKVLRFAECRGEKDSYRVLCA